MTTEYTPIANGTSTDHPYPNLPFVDDSHLPVDKPDEIQRIGRGVGDMWGRADYERGARGERGEWIALTTDPKNPSYCWCVRYHPKLGRSVLLFKDRDMGSVHDHYWNDHPRLFLRRAGGYGWDGDTWYRPRQVIDWSSSGYTSRPATGATTITAQDLLDPTADSAQGQAYRVARFEPHDVDEAQWRHDLALWAKNRAPDARPLDQCLVTLNAPELHQLLTIDEIAERTGIAASTLRGYISRGQSDVPTPQITRSNRPLWASSVVDDWLERRKRDRAENVLATGDPDDSGLAPGLKAAWDELSWQLGQALQRPGAPIKRRSDVQKVANELGWIAALTVERLLPRKDVLTYNLESAVLWDLRDSATQEPIGGHYPLMMKTQKMLAWYIRHYPDSVNALFGEIISEAEIRLQIPKDLTQETLRNAAYESLDDTELQHIREFIDLVLPPSTN